MEQYQWVPVDIQSHLSFFFFPSFFESVARWCPKETSFSVALQRSTLSRSACRTEELLSLCSTTWARLCVFPSQKNSNRIIHRGSPELRTADSTAAWVRYHGLLLSPTLLINYATTIKLYIHERPKKNHPYPPMWLGTLSLWLGRSIRKTQR